ncbi:class I SAM-dependent methyltransferase [Sphingomonas sp.]|uniref:class I SAM-dependent methyltransferase n=1 Tax=Sphingomonas sp. TaxID=28214 RepID=UPI003AFFCBA7
MARCNAQYYATRDPLGAAGDFTTAPEISQMFGELVGLALADLWDRAGRPAARYVELGPGRGTLAADATRAMAVAGFTPAVHLVETSPVLRAAQAGRLPGAVHHEAVDDLPDADALLVVANEFFDALPIRQTVAGRERAVTLDGDRLAFEPAAGGAVTESCPTGVTILRTLATQIARQGGAALLIDYGYEGPLTGDTLQAVRGHRFADPLDRPGEQDLTAHVDLAALADAARAEGCAVHGPLPQGAWLVALGIDARASALARASGQDAMIAAARRRLVDREEMGMLFKVLAVTARGWPTPAGFT